MEQRAGAIISSKLISQAGRRAINNQAARMPACASRPPTCALKGQERLLVLFLRCPCRRQLLLLLGGAWGVS